MKSIPGEVDRLKQIVDENPQSMQFARLAEYLLQMNRIPEAIEVCKNGIENHHNYPNAHFVLGQCYFKTQEFDSAESEFNKVLLHDPEHVQAHHLQAKIMKERGWSNAYLLWLKRALTVDPLDKLSQSLIDDYSEEEMDLEEETTLEKETDETSAETMVAEPYFDKEHETAPDEVEMDVEETEEEIDLSTEKIETEVETSSFDDEFDDEKLSEGEVAIESEESDKRYEYIIDDIFKDEVSSDESLETLEEEIESYETPEDIISETEDVTEDISEEVVEEKIDEIEEKNIEDEDEIVTQIRDKVEQFENEEKESQEFPTEFEQPMEETKEEANEPIEETFDEEIKTEISEEVEEEIPDITTTEIEEEETKLKEEKTDLNVQEIEVEKTSQFEEEISTLDRERAAREVFGNDDEISEESTETLEEESEFRFQTEDIEERAEQTEAETTIDETPSVTETPTEEKPASSGKDPIVTSTLGEIYAAQGHFAKAIGVYEILQKKNPDNPVYKQKIEELNRKQEEAEQQG